jgi:hypothetical protein
MAANNLNVYNQLVAARGHTLDMQTAIIIAETLNITNEIFRDIPILPTNQKLVHRVGRFTSKPAGTALRLGRGTAAELATNEVIQEPVAAIRSIAEYNRDLIKLAANESAEKSRYGRQSVMGLSESAATQLFYGNHAEDPDEMNGLATRTNAIDTEFVIDAGGTGSNLTSLYLVMWDETRCHGIYPEGHPAFGIEMETFNAQRVEDANGLITYVDDDQFTFWLGLAVPDKACLGRICNIDLSGGANAIQMEDVLKIKNKMQSYYRGRVFAYANSALLTQIQILAINKPNVQYNPMAPWGDNDDMAFSVFGAIFRQCESILSTETRITATA